ncbi:MAG: CCA tRNA nucleotidyltransferase [Hyphomicrobium sp.]
MTRATPKQKDNSTIAEAAWFQAPALRRVFDMMRDGGSEARVVGGAVRNTLIGSPVTDIDLATPAVPERVMDLARAAGLGVHPTGLAHGTVTIVADGHPFEMTTLRHDVETDGRHAVVAFTDDWAADACRRDFTINALYAKADGSIVDDVGGLADLAARRVRFIGNATDRIREDYLRILRFFRFTAQYAAGAPDDEGLAAAIALKDGLTRLSAERVGAEVVKLVLAPRAADVADVMREAGILSAVLGSDGDTQLLRRVIAIETALVRPGDAMLRLAALAVTTTEDGARLAQRLRLSNADGDALATAMLAHPAYDPARDDKAARALLYATGVARFERGAIAAWARSDAPIPDSARAARVTLPARWQAPKMPVRGADLLAAGVDKGPRLGAILKAFEDWWVENDFPSDPDVVRRSLDLLIKQA